MKLGIISVIIGVLCLIYYVASRSTISFAIFFAGLGSFFLFFGIYKLFIKKGVIMARAPWLVYIVRIGTGLVIISFIIIECLIFFAANTSSKGDGDYIVILGAMVRGETPSMILQERLDAGLVCMNEHPQAKVVLSGGRGVGEDISEAEAMKRYLISKGVNSERLILEDKSTSTSENINFTKKIINKENVKLIIVTSDFHILRAEMLAKRNGFEVIGYSAKTYMLLRPTYYVREYFGIIKSFFFDKGAEKK